MSGVRLRSAAAGDEAALRALWRETFRDEEAVIDAFFDCLYTPEDVQLAESGEGLLSAAYLLRGVQLCVKDRQIPAAYFYALATRPDCRGRGLGRAITQACLRAGAQRGETLCLMPGTESLRRWYADVSGLLSFGSARELSCAASDAGKTVISELSAEEYVRQRESLLSGEAHASLPTRFYHYQQRLCTLSGGALLLLRGADGTEGLACCEREEENVRVPELLWSREAEEAAAALASHFGARHCTARVPGEGIQTVMSGDKTLRAPFWWGPAFD